MDISYFANPLNMMMVLAPDADLVVQSENCECCRECDACACACLWAD